MKIAFLGTPQSAVPFLEKLSQEKEIEIVAVITQPDRPFGRKQEIIKPAVKIAAERKNLRIYQPNNQTELAKITKNLDVDFFVVIAYGMILTKEILAIPKLAAVNVHFSLLPKYRGASPLQESLLNGDKESGISIFKIDEKLDHGQIYLSERIAISDDDNFQSLIEKTTNIGAETLPHTLIDINNGLLIAKAQDEEHEKPSYCHKIKKEDGKIDWKSSTEKIKNMIRAYTPWPGVFTLFNNKKLKILAAKIEETNINRSPGTFFTENKILKVQTGNGLLIPEKLQFEGKTPISAKEFVNGQINFLKNTRN